MRQKHLLWLSCALALAGATPLAAQSKVDDYIRATMAESRIPGLSVAVVKNGKIVKASGYGIANLETNTPATAQTVYKTASLSKQFIAAAIMLLVQEGKLSLDDKASKYLDGSPETWKDITVRHLLTSTSGIVRDPRESDYEPYREQPITDVIKATYPIPSASTRVKNGATPTSGITRSRKSSTRPAASHGATSSPNDCSRPRG